MASHVSWFSNNAAKCALVGVLAIPAVVAPCLDTRQMGENRHLAALPAAPATWPEFLALPGKSDAWVKDHFGFRTELVKTNNLLRFTVFHEFPSIQMAAGQNGRVFLAAHGTNVAPYSALTDSCIGRRTDMKDFISYLNGLFDDFHAKGLAPRLMIVPSAPVVQSDDTPAWISSVCATSTPPAKTLIEDPALSARVRAATWYPLAQMRAIEHATPVFPKTWFHWGGSGLEQVAQGSVSALFPKVPAEAPHLRTHAVVLDSDVSHLFPGVRLPSVITQPDLDASRVDGCYGKTCFPEFGSYAALLDDASRFHNPAAPDRRLVILSDSFGSKISAWYARHYRTVEQVATNNFGQLTAEQIAGLGKFLFREPANTDILFLYHDGGIYGTLRMGLQRLHGTGGSKAFHRPEEYKVLAQQMYVSYLGRPADLDGLQSFQRQLSETGAPVSLQDLNLSYGGNAGVRELIDKFGQSAESMAMYSGSTSAFVTSIYEHMFNRQPDAGGLRYWSSAIDKGEVTRGRASLAIAAAALVDATPQGVRDGALLRKKVAFGTLFTDTLGKAKHQCYSGAKAANNARSMIGSVRAASDMSLAQSAANKMSDAACR